MSVITTEEVKQGIVANSIVVIDVRDKEELVYGMLPTAHHIPWQEILSAFQLTNDLFKQTYGFVKPAKQQKVVVYCRTGGRSQMAAMLLQSQGYAAYNYTGSIWEWASVDKNVQRYGPTP